jgi:uroporphyrinogen-III synthase
VVELPLLEISPCRTDGLLAALARWRAHTRLCAGGFVSPNAIDAAFAHIDHWPAGVKLAWWARAAARRWQRTASGRSIVSPADAAQRYRTPAAGARPAGAAGKPVLIIRGDSGRELMADGLRAAGAVVDVVPAYRRQCRN